MFKKKQLLPAYSTIIGEGTEVAGGIRFSGALHIAGKVSGDIKGLADGNGCALTLGQSGSIEGSLDVANVVLDGAVIGDVRAANRVELASGARIEGTIYYGVLEMAEGAEVNGKLVHIDASPAPRLVYGGSEQVDAAGDGPAACDGAAARAHRRGEVDVRERSPFEGDEDA
jgi:cytoskeletal protein CcmA (bactofilin family)